MMTSGRSCSVAVSVCVLIGVGACLDAVGPPPLAGKDATVLWRVPGIAAVGAPALDDSSVFVFDTLGVLRAFARRTGQPRWQRTITTEGTYRGIGAAAGTVVLSAGSLVGIDAVTGTERWRIPNRGVSPMALNDSLIAVSGLGLFGELAALSASNGLERWRTSVWPTDSVAPFDRDANFKTPAFSTESVVASFEVRRSQPVLRGGIARFDPRTGIRRWTTMLPVTNNLLLTTPSAAAVGGGSVAVSAFDGFVYVFDESSGASRWTGGPLQVAGRVVLTNGDDRPVAIAGQFVVVGSIFGYLNVHNVQTGQLTWSVFTQLGPVREILPVGQGLVLAGHYGGGLALLELATGAIRWRLTPLADIDRVDGMRVVGDTVFATSLAGGLSVFRLP